jgi:hypothetical protein
MYGIASNLAVGLQIERRLYNEDAPASQAIIRFYSGSGGLLRVGRAGEHLLRHKFERFRFLKAVNEIVCDSGSDEDRPAWCLIGALDGEHSSLSESFCALLERSDKLFREWVQIDG